jgi:hypothetical protein
MVPIGIAARHLHKDMEMGGTVKSQLQHWKDIGLLDRVPPTVDALVDYADAQATLNDRARAYLDIHCGHCHSRGGPANTSGLRLDAHETDAVALGIGKPPVAAGRGSGNRAYDIVPGKPDASILLYRMQSLDPGVAMPELGRDLVHEEGVALIREWIKKMKQ